MEGWAAVSTHCIEGWLRCGVRARSCVMHGSIRPSVSMSTADPPEVVPGSRLMALGKVIPGSCGWGRSARYSGAFAVRLAIEEARGSRNGEWWKERGRS
jgi:hypothetical protein